MRRAAELRLETEQLRELKQRTEHCEDMMKKQEDETSEHHDFEEPKWRKKKGQKKQKDRNDNQIEK